MRSATSSCVPLCSIASPPAGALLLTTLVPFIIWSLLLLQAVVNGQEGTSTICSPASNTFTARINFNEGHLGYFEFAECDGVHPTIGLKIGTMYVFDQSDVSNWFHPMGFAYGPDGALADQDELELGISRTGSSCATTKSCPAPLYHLNGQFLGDKATNAEDFGLDNYEPKFFLPILDWIGQGKFSINVTFDDTSIDQDAFYFCHVGIVALMQEPELTHCCIPFVFLDPPIHVGSDQISG